MKINIEPADFFLVDSQKTGAKIVKFFQTAPTWVQHIWRKFRGTQETVRFYHVGNFYDAVTLIEQQGKVIKRSADKLLSTNNRLMIVRVKDIGIYQQQAIIEVAMEDLGEGYDILNIFGKLFTWLTGIPLFAMYMQWPNQDICVNRTAYWLKRAIGMNFGVSAHSALTTHTMYKYIIAHPSEFDIIYNGNPREDNLKENLL